MRKVPPPPVGIGGLRRGGSIGPDGAPDEAAVMQHADAIGQAETEMHKHRLATMLEIRALLTPEQRQELTQIIIDAEA